MRSTKLRPSPPVRLPKLNREAFVLYLEELRVGDQVLTEAQARAWFRWRCEDTCPQFVKADDFLVVVFGRTIDLYVAWCHGRGLNPWAGEAESAAA